MYFGKYFIQDYYDDHTVNIVFYMPLQKLAAFFFVVCKVVLIYLMSMHTTKFNVCDQF